MSSPEQSFGVNVDVANPGQFFACCGLLELAHRMPAWGDVEGHFNERGSFFEITVGNGGSTTIESLVSQLSQCEIAGLSIAERQERESLEAERRQLKKEGRELHGDKEERRKMLGTKARAGAVFLGSPFCLALDWWQTEDEGATTPKTWAGLQEIHKVARAAQNAFSGIESYEQCLDYACVLRTPAEYCKQKVGRDKAVEPFYFDSRRFAHALDTGFSLDVQGAETLAHPAVELLCLIGLQRFRPNMPEKWTFEYTVWNGPLSAPVAAAVVGGMVPAGAQQRHRFHFHFRDDQKRYKAFSFAIPIGDGA